MINQNEEDNDCNNIENNFNCKELEINKEIDFNYLINSNEIFLINYLDINPNLITNIIPNFNTIPYNDIINYKILIKIENNKCYILFNNNLNFNENLIRKKLYLIQDLKSNYLNGLYFSLKKNCNNLNDCELYLNKNDLFLNNKWYKYKIIKKYKKNNYLYQNYDNYCPKDFNIIIKSKKINNLIENKINEIPLNNQIILDNINGKIPFSFLLKNNNFYICFIYNQNNLTIQIPNSNNSFTTNLNGINKLIKKLENNKLLLKCKRFFKIILDYNNIKLKIYKNSNYFNFNDNIKLINLSIIPIIKCNFNFEFFTNKIFNYGNPYYLLNSPFEIKNVSYLNMLENYKNNNILVCNYCNNYTLLDNYGIECNGKRFKCIKNNNIYKKNDLEIIIKKDHLKIKGKNNLKILYLFSGNRQQFCYIKKNWIKIPFIIICIYKDLNFNFNKCININYELNNKDFKEILFENNILNDIKFKDFLPNLLINKNVIIIYKLIINDLFNSNKLKCIYFTINYIDNNKLIICNFNKIKNNNLKYYNKIIQSYRINLNIINKEIIFKINLENNNKLIFNLNKKELEINNFSDIFNLLIPLNGNYNQNNKFNFEIYKLLDIKMEKNHTSFINFYSNLNYSKEILINKINYLNFNNILINDYTIYNKLTFCFKIKLYYLNNFKIININYIVKPLNYYFKTNFKNKGILIYNNWRIKINKDLIKIDINSIKTLNFEIFNLKNSYYKDFNKIIYNLDLDLINLNKIKITLINILYN